MVSSELGCRTLLLNVTYPELYYSLRNAKRGEVYFLTMFESKTRDGRGILRSETYLDTGFQPEKPMGRRSEINRIVEAVKPVTRLRIC